MHPMFTRRGGLLAAVLCPLLASVLVAGPAAASGGRIVGGQRAERSAYPAFTIVGSGCGGALVAPDRVLTAAHCSEALIDDPTVRVGPQNVRRTALRYAIHPTHIAFLASAGSDPGPGPGDLLVIQLDRAVPGIQPLDVATAADRATAPGTAATTIGVGVTGPDKQDFGTFRDGRVQILDDDDCKRLLTDAPFRRWFLCTRDPRALAGGSGPFTSGCFGDSGSPLLVETPAGRRIAGVDSFGPACGTEDDPEGYADATEGRAFIYDPSPAWAPSAFRRPALRGRARPGGRLTCSVRWSVKPKAPQYGFFTEKGLLAKGSSAGYRVRRADRGRRIACAGFGTGPGGFGVTPSSAPVRVGG